MQFFLRVETEFFFFFSQQYAVVKNGIPESKVQLDFKLSTLLTFDVCQHLTYSSVELFSEVTVLFYDGQPVKPEQQD